MNNCVESHEGYWYPDTALCFLESYLAWLSLSNNGDSYCQHAHANVMLGLKFFLKHDEKYKGSEESGKREHARDDSQTNLRKVNID
jgi:hypothetical protein